MTQRLTWHIKEPHGLMAVGESGTVYSYQRQPQDYTLTVSQGNTVHELWSPSAQASYEMADVIEKSLLTEELR